MTFRAIFPAVLWAQACAQLREKVATHICDKQPSTSRCKLFNRGCPRFRRMAPTLRFFMYDCSMIVDNAIYVDGRRTAEPASLQETYEACRQRGGVAWIDLYKPTEEELESVAQEFGLHRWR